MSPALPCCKRLHVALLRHHAVGLLEWTSSTFTERKAKFMPWESRDFRQTASLMVTGSNHPICRRESKYEARC